MGNAGSIGDAILFPAPPSSYDISLPNLVWIDEEFSISKAREKSASLGDGEIKNTASSSALGPSNKNLPNGSASSRGQECSGHPNVFPAIWFAAPADVKPKLLFYTGTATAVT
eukprot:GHVT01002907.1.p1 GENE.GHVT01002907.1~~GHVT01002907.1.p1  ORF type:complete len:113 (+),score=14.40 GHVT01002907.1:361-699(+)